MEIPEADVEAVITLIPSEHRAIWFSREGRPEEILVTRSEATVVLDAAWRSGWLPRSEAESLRAEIARLRRALRRLSIAYVSLLESGRDRIVALGGECDPVDVMEERDPALREARLTLGEDTPNDR